MPLKLIGLVSQIGGALGDKAAWHVDPKQVVASIAHLSAAI
jgi:hypothetical protein